MVYWCWCAVGPIMAFSASFDSMTPELGAMSEWAEERAALRECDAEQTLGLWTGVITGLQCTKGILFGNRKKGQCDGELRNFCENAEAAERLARDETCGGLKTGNSIKPRSLR